MRVVAAAIKIGSVIMTMPKPHRHRDIIKSLLEECNNPCRIALESSEKCNQGFILSNGTFATREESLRIAIKSGQIEDTSQSTLVSQDLW